MRLASEHNRNIRGMKMGTLYIQDIRILMENLYIILTKIQEKNSGIHRQPDRDLFGACYFYSSISNKLSEATAKEFGIDDSTNYAQLVTDKNAFPLVEGALI